MVNNMKQFMDKFYFTLTHLTILILFSLPITDFFQKNIMLYALMFFVIMISTFAVENELNKKFSLQEKAKKFCKSLLPINVIIYAIFILFIF
jgi:hypothetical protein